MNKPRLLDFFCAAGGATKGYQQAGFYVVGVDIKPQPHYCGDEFYQADALTYPLEGFDAYHASPPCQGGSEITPVAYRVRYPNLIASIRQRLKATKKPYVIENVECMRHHFVNPVELCGTQFGLRVWRHRFFEIEPEMFQLMPPCNHVGHPVLVTGQRMGRDGVRVKEPTAQERRDAMGIDWMIVNELDEAIPPAYTEYIGKYLMQVVAHD